MELRERLRLALRSGSTSGATHAPARFEPPALRSIEAIANLRRRHTELGTVYVAEQSWPLDHRHGRLSLGEITAINALALRRLAPGLSVERLTGAAFVDVETTGLAGGTGTYVFLVGVGTFTKRSFTVRQFFLADLSRERAMLAAVTDALGERPALVSFNGRRFDLPLLGSRLTLNRLASLPDIHHLDLLYPARRLYRRRLSSCQLGVLEESLLGLARSDDVPGWVVPSLYIEYVRTGRADGLHAVFRHNALDILSLVTLLAHLGHLVGGTAPAEAEDYVALGRWDESEGRLAEAASTYAVALEVGDGGARITARQRLAHIFRRLNRLEAAADLWREEVESDGPLERRIAALIELAKLEEHRWRDCAAAEALTQRALSLIEVAAAGGPMSMGPQLQKEALEHRLGRVRRRLAAIGGDVR